MNYLTLIKGFALLILAMGLIIPLTIVKKLTLTVGVVLPLWEVLKNKENDR